MTEERTQENNGASETKVTLALDIQTVLEKAVYTAIDVLQRTVGFHRTARNARTVGFVLFDMGLHFLLEGKADKEALRAFFEDHLVEQPKERAPGTGTTQTPEEEQYDRRTGWAAKILGAKIKTLKYLVVEDDQPEQSGDTAQGG